MDEGTDCRKTVLHDRHVALGARMGPFGGFVMPIQYEGILKEHTAARDAVALFDVCHMGEFSITGPTAVEDLEHLLSCSVASLGVGRCRYGLLCNQSGGVIDDLIVYRSDVDTFMLVVNAGTRGGDLDWVTAHVSAATAVEDRSDDTAKIDIQGPDAPRLAESLLAESITGLRYFGFMHNRFRDREVLVSRTGYTGEIGFEIYCENDIAGDLWDACVEAGAVPAGLGARDTLRLEIGLPLYGHELSRATNAAAAGMPWALASKSFVGSDAVRAYPGTHVLVGLVLDGRRAARHGDTLRDADGRDIGHITSGSFAPSLGHAIAMAYLETVNATVGRSVRIDTGRTELEGTVCERPFYSNATARQPMARFL